MAIRRSAIFLGLLLFLPGVVFAQDATTQVAEAAGFFSGDLYEIIGRFIKFFLGFLGVIALLLTLYAGYLWMTAGGDDGKVDEAKTILRNAVIGLLIIMSAYAIVTFIFDGILGRDRSGGAGGGNGRVGVERLSGALGQAISDHFPERGATDVPRNVRVIVTFRDAIDPASLIEGGVQGGVVRREAFALYPSAGAEVDALTNVTVTFTEDRRTFVFDPAEYLGSPTEDVAYTVRLSSDIRLTGGASVLPREDYEWRFTTGTFLDTTPPTVVSYRPPAQGTFARNILYQVTFDEAIDPSSATGIRSAGAGFDNLSVSPTGGAPLPGVYTLSNGYRTVTFVSSDACGTNSCGETLYCLPASAALTATVRAPALSAEPPQAIAPYTGVADVSGNALDGNGDGTAGDSLVWAFATNDEIVLDGPRLRGPLSPDIRAEGVSLDHPLSFETEDILMMSTVNSDSIALTNIERPSGDSHAQWFTHRVSFVDATGLPVTSPAQTAARSVVTLPHGTFLASQDGALYEYETRIDESLRNEYQNCFVPAQGPGLGGAASCGTSLAQPYCCNGVPSAQSCPALATP